MIPDMFIFKDLYNTIIGLVHSLWAEGAVGRLSRQQ